MSNVALITGITGQDGSYLAELLLDKGYAVHGVARRTSMMARGRIDGLREDALSSGKTFDLHYGDLGDSSSLNQIVGEDSPRPSCTTWQLRVTSVSRSSSRNTRPTWWRQGRCVCSRRSEANKLETRFYQASTSELYGKVQEIPQSETTPFYPRSPYAVSKLYALLDREELPRVVRDAREQRHPVQP